MLVQESAPAIGFDPILNPPDEWMFLVLGNMPASIVDSLVMPKSLARSRTRWPDPWWLLLHEIFSTVIWFALGALVDLGLLGIKKLIFTYILGRLSIAALLLLGNVASIGWRLEVIVWLLFGLYGLAVGLRRAWATIRARRAESLSVAGDGR